MSPEALGRRLSETLLKEEDFFRQLADRSACLPCIALAQRGFSSASPKGILVGFSLVKQRKEVVIIFSWSTHRLRTPMPGLRSTSLRVGCYYVYEPGISSRVIYDLPLH